MARAKTAHARMAHHVASCTDLIPMPTPAGECVDNGYYVKCSALNLNDLRDVDRVVETGDGSVARRRRRARREAAGEVEQRAWAGTSAKHLRRPPPGGIGSAYISVSQFFPQKSLLDAFASKLTSLVPNDPEPSWSDLGLSCVVSWVWLQDLRL